MQIERIKLKTIEFMKKCRECKILVSFEEDETRCGNEPLKLFLDQWQSIERSIDGHFNGGNDSRNSITLDLQDISHIIPANCRFISTDIQNIKEFDPPNEYDLIVMDPPWWNRYVRRSKKFNRENG